MREDCSNGKDEDGCEECPEDMTKCEGSWRQCRKFNLIWGTSICEKDAEKNLDIMVIS